MLFMRKRFTFASFHSIAVTSNISHNLWTKCLLHSNWFSYVGNFAGVIQSPYQFFCFERVFLGIARLILMKLNTYQMWKSFNWETALLMLSHMYNYFCWLNSFIATWKLGQYLQSLPNQCLVWWHINTFSFSAQASGYRHPPCPLCLSACQLQKK